MSIHRYPRSAHRTVVRAALLSGMLLLSFTLLSAKVYLTEDAAPSALFPKADTFEKRVVQVTPELERRLNTMITPRSPWESQYTTFIAAMSGEPLGYAVVLNEIGKTRPITFIVGITHDGAVRGVEIMVYREPRGGEVRHRRFLRQYRGKRLDDAIVAYQDIINITGATLSVRGLNRGVKKALALVTQVYLGNPGTGLEEEKNRPVPDEAGGETR